MISYGAPLWLAPALLVNTVEVSRSGQLFSLLWYGNNYGINKFCSIGPSLYSPIVSDTEKTI